RIAGVITDFQRELLAEHAALGVEIGDGLLCAVLHLLAESRVLSGHRTCGRNRDVCVGSARERHPEGQGYACLEQSFHRFLPWEIELRPLNRSRSFDKPPLSGKLSRPASSRNLALCLTRIHFFNSGAGCRWRQLSGPVRS